MPNPLLLDIPELFTSERLIIRAPRAGDGAAVNAAVRESLPELRPWLPWVQSAPTLEDSEAMVRRKHADFLKREDLMLLLFRKRGGECVGASGLHRINWLIPSFDIGYWQRTSMTGNGYLTEAVNAITAFAFDALSATRVTIHTDDRNHRSARVAERCGFVLEGILRKDSRGVAGELRDSRVYAKTR